MRDPYFWEFNGLWGEDEAKYKREQRLARKKATKAMAKNKSQRS